MTAGLFVAAPDLDTYAARLLRIPYGSFFGHRGFLHTPFFLAALAADGGAGIMAVFPFSEQRFFFPWRPIRVSPLSVTRFFQQAGEILRSELPFCIGSIAIGASLLLIGRYERLRR